MATIKYKPTTPARRNMSVPDFAEITKFSPEKSLVVIKKKHAGRNSYGRITVRHKGGGNKQKYRIIDFKRAYTDEAATVIGIEYDPNRTAYIALLQYEDGTKKYMIAPVGLTDGDKVYSGADADLQHRAVSRQGRPACPFGGLGSTADGKRERYGAGKTSFW